MEISEKDVRTYVRPDGICPFNNWLEALRNRQARARIRAPRPVRQFGRLQISRQWRFGPGYRVYFAIAETKLIILLCGGDKGSQSGAIRKTIAYWEDYKK